MASATVYDGVLPRDGARTGVFEGQKLWFSRNVPMRSRFMHQAESNGAEIVVEEKHADVLLVDHAKKPAAPGTHSYQYVELSVRNGLLEDLADHAVGVTDRANRPVGSITTASKGERTPFTAADDQFLWDWIKPYAEAGGAAAGNEIYKQLEKANPRHTFQSWRDRWLKYVSTQDRQRPPVTPDRQTIANIFDMSQSPTASELEEKPFKGRFSDFTTSDARMLFKAANNILGTDEEDLPESWQKVAGAYGPHSAREWRSFFEHEVKDVCLRQVEQRKKVKKDRQGDPSDKPSNEPQRADGPEGGNDETEENQDPGPGPQVDRTESGRSSVPADQREHERPPLKEQETKMPTKVEIAQMYSLSPQFVTQSSSVSHLPLKNRSSPKRPTGRPRKYPRDESRRESRDQGVQTSPIRELTQNSPAISPSSRANHPQCPEFRPVTPTTSRQPGPNEARKRSATKGTNSNENSQESISSAGEAIGAVDGSIAIERTKDRGTQDQQASSPLKRKRVVSEEESDMRNPVMPSIEDILENPQSKRSKRIHTSTTVHDEIYSTPAAEATVIKRNVKIEISELLTDEDVDGLDLPIIRPTGTSSTSSGDEGMFISEDETPTQKAVPPKVHAPTPPPPSKLSATRDISHPVSMSMSPSEDPSVRDLEAVRQEILKPEMLGGEEVSTERQDLVDDNDPQTSPLSLKLVSSDAIEPESPGPDAATREDSPEESDEIYETAPPDQRRSEEVFETAPQYHTQPNHGGEEDKILEVAESESEDEDSVDSEAIIIIRESEIGGEQTTKLYRSTRHETSRIETQDLFDPIPHPGDSLADLFAIPDPEGGWTTIEDDEAKSSGLDEDRNGREKEGSDVDEGEELSPSRPFLPQQKAVTTAASNLSSPPQRTQGSPPPTRSAPQPKTHPRPQSPKPQAQSTLQSQIMAYLSTQLSSNPHTSEIHLISAIQATCFSISLVPRVYHSLSSGHGLPKNMKGCWTDKDDEILGRSKRAEVAKLEGKHGPSGVRRRIAWLFGDDDAAGREEEEDTIVARSTSGSKQPERRRQRLVPVVVIDDRTDDDEEEGEFWRSAGYRTSKSPAG